MMIQIRPFEPTDRDFVLALAPRLLIGRRSWRDADLWLQAVEGWLTESIAQHPAKTTVLIAHDGQGVPLGFATVSHSTHFTGQAQAYIGELATSEAAEGRGVGSALIAACEQWAREQGYALLTVSTGAANTRALDLYHRLGFHDEDLTLTKPLFEETPL
jgi:ribosomal protein S18 acetylase RimI-like enzyme